MGESCLLFLLCWGTGERASCTSCEQASSQCSHSRHHAPSGTGYPGSAGDFLFVLKVRLIKKLVSLLILRLLYLASDIVTRTGLFPKLQELGKSKMLWFKAVRLGFDFLRLVNTLRMYEKIE